MLNFLSNVAFLPSHRQAGFTVMNIRSTLRTAPDLCKNVSLVVLFGKGKGKSKVFPLQARRGPEGG